MDSFWKNIIRYPKFLISSSIGLILVIITPFRNLFKIPKLRNFLILLILLIVISIFLIIVNMTGL